MGLNLKDIKDDLAYNDCPNWDSLKHLQMISQFETEFNIDIEMDDVIAMITVRDIYKILAKYLK
jgi:acyl carrier protein